jgi:small-conductance mechanosensitive channel
MLKVTYPNLFYTGLPIRTVMIKMSAQDKNEVPFMTSKRFRYADIILYGQKRRLEKRVNDDREAAELRESLRQFRESMKSDEEKLREKFEASKNLVIW